MEEETALTKWCPFSRVSGFDERHNRDDPGRLVKTDNGPSYNRQWVQDYDVNQQNVDYHSRKNLTPSACMCLATRCMMWDYQTGDCGLKRNYYVLSIT